jgi:hypothetical protein
MTIKLNKMKKIIKHLQSFLICLAVAITIAITTIAMLVGLMILFPGEVELTKNQAVSVIIVGIVLIAFGLKATFNRD